MKDEHTNSGAADPDDELTGADLEPHVDTLRGAVSSLEQVTALIDRLSPGGRRRTLERLPELLNDHGSAVYDLRRIIEEYLRRRYP